MGEEKIGWAHGTYMVVTSVLALLYIRDKVKQAQGRKAVAQQTKGQS